jgi:hypothetical protein
MGVILDTLAAAWLGGSCVSERHGQVDVAWTHVVFPVMAADAAA